VTVPAELRSVPESRISRLLTVLADLTPGETQSALEAAVGVEILNSVPVDQLNEIGIRLYAATSTVNAGGVGLRGKLFIASADDNLLVICKKAVIRGTAGSGVEFDGSPLATASIPAGTNLRTVRRDALYGTLAANAPAGTICRTDAATAALSADAVDQAAIGETTPREAIGVPLISRQQTQLGVSQQSYIIMIQAQVDNQAMGGNALEWYVVDKRLR